MVWMEVLGRQHHLNRKLFSQMTWHLNNVCSSSSSSVKQTQSSYWLLCSTMSLDHLYQNYHLLCPLQSQNNLPAHLTRKWPVGNYAIKADLKAFARSALTSAFGEFTVKQLSQDCWVVNSDNRASPWMSCFDNQGFCFGWLLFRTSELEREFCGSDLKIKHFCLSVCT